MKLSFDIDIEPTLHAMSLRHHSVLGNDTSLTADSCGYASASASGAKTRGPAFPGHCWMELSVLVLPKP